MFSMACYSIWDMYRFSMLSLAIPVPRKASFAMASTRGDALVNQLECGR